MQNNELTHTHTAEQDLVNVKYPDLDLLKLSVIALDYVCNILNSVDFLYLRIFYRLPKLLRTVLAENVVCVLLSEVVHHSDNLNAFPCEL